MRYRPSELRRIQTFILEMSVLFRPSLPLTSFLLSFIRYEMAPQIQLKFEEVGLWGRMEID